MEAAGKAEEESIGMAEGGACKKKLVGSAAGAVGAVTAAEAMGRAEGLLLGNPRVQA